MAHIRKTGKNSKATSAVCCYNETGMNGTDHEALYRQAIRAGEQRDYRTAVSLLTGVITATEDFPHALLYLGRSYHALGEYNRAVPVLEFYLRRLPESEPGHFFLGRSYLALGMYRRAISNLKYAVERNPKLLPGLSYLAIAFLKIKRPDAAVHFFERALELDPDSERIFTGYLNALVVKAIRLYRRGDHSEAGPIFDFIIKNQSGALLPHFYLGNIYRENGNDEQALEQYDIASRLSPKDPIFPMLRALIHIKRGDSVAAIREMEKSSIGPNQMPMVRDADMFLRFIAISLFREKRYKDAIDYGKKVLKADYKDADIHAMVAESFLNLGELEKSKNHFQRSIDFGQARAEYHHGLAATLWELGDCEELMKEVRRIRRLSANDTTASYFEALCLARTEKEQKQVIPLVQALIRDLGPDVQLMHALGRAYLETGMPELSEGWFLRALKLDRDHRHSYRDLIRNYRILGKNTELKRVMSRYLKRFPRDRRTRRNYIHLLIQTEAFDKAIREITAWLARHPRSKSIKKNLAYCYYMTGRFPEAAIIYKDLLRDKPSSMPLLRSMVICLDKSGNTEAAIELLKRAMGYFGEEPSVMLPLGVLYSRTGRYEPAKEVFRRVLSVAPRDWRAHQSLGVLYQKTGQKLFAAKFMATAQKYRQNS